MTPVLAKSKGGSIPAGAGEPAPTSRKRPSSRVYPRGCGGTELEDEIAGGDTGLSPRVRGNLAVDQIPAHLPGSIPAGAGEPAVQAGGLDLDQVYPRGCGGTVRVMTSPSLT